MHNIKFFNVKWIYIIEHKLKAAFFLGLILLVVLWNNIVERNKMIKLGESFQTIYEDRLLAENYIYKMSELLHQGLHLIPEEMNDKSAALFVKNFEKIKDNIKPLIALYDETLLTKNESVLFQNLNKNTAKIDEKYSELENMDAHNDNQYQNINQIKQSLENSLTTLSSMSDIQIMVGKELMEQSEASVKSSFISSQFEVGLIIVIALIIQALIFTSKTVHSKFQQNSNLN